MSIETILEQALDHAGVELRVWKEGYFGIKSEEELEKRVSEYVLSLLKAEVEKLKKGILSAKEFNTMNDEGYALKTENHIGYDQAIIDVIDLLTK